MNNDEVEFGSDFEMNLNFTVNLYDSKGNIIEQKCKCGNEATTFLIGKEAYMGLCQQCAFG